MAESIRHQLADNDHMNLHLVKRTMMGFDVDSAYGEVYWLPVIGPSSLWMLRRLVAWATDGVTEFSPLELGHMLGLGKGNGFNAPVVKSMERLVRFGCAGFTPPTYMVRPVLPPLPAARVRTLPATLQQAHADYIVPMPA